MSRNPSFVFRRQIARDRRREQRMTIVDTAEALGVGESTYAAWERGRYQPPLKRIAELAVVLQLPLTDLVAPPQPALPAQLRRTAEVSIEALADVIDVPVAQVAAAEDGDTRAAPTRLATGLEKYERGKQRCRVSTYFCPRF